MVSGVIEQAWLEVDEFVEAFELAWTADAVPEITDFLPTAEHPQFSETLLELVRVDLELRWQHGCVKTIDDYRHEFPELLDDAESLGQIAFEEFRTRRQSGDSVTAVEYASRFGICTDNWPAITSVEQHDAQASGFPKNGGNHSLARRAGFEATPNYFPEVGSDVLGFHLQSELGRGTFSRVYWARQGDLANRLVVLKVSAESFAEADKLAQLQHANIVPIYSVHRAGQLSAVCMPYFGAATLADVVRDVHGLGSLPPSGRVIVETLNACGQRTVAARQNTAALLYDFRSTENDPGERGGVSPPPVVSPANRGADAAPLAKEMRETRPMNYDGALKTLSGLTYVEAVLWIGAKLADGLSHAHERGILHRDLKPANVLLADDGRPMLLDFNLSADLKQSASVREMLVGGTLPYMAPEQIYAFQQRIHSGDTRSDMFSLGVILFELLAGRNPFSVRQGSVGDAAGKHASGSTAIAAEVAFAQSGSDARCRSNHSPLPRSRSGSALSNGCRASQSSRTTLEATAAASHARALVQREHAAANECVIFLRVKKDCLRSVGQWQDFDLTEADLAAGIVLLEGEVPFLKS